MELHAVRGGPWNWDRDLRSQAEFGEHARFMDELTDSGFVLLGGPLEGDREVQLVIDAPGEDAIRARLADDPWIRNGPRQPDPRRTRRARGHPHRYPHRPHLAPPLAAPTGSWIKTPLIGEVAIHDHERRPGGRWWRSCASTEWLTVASIERWTILLDGRG